MATSMEQIDLTKSGYFCEFSGSSEADIANAKTFWKSILLMPPAESRLVSGDIRQRLKVAGPPSQVVNITHQPVEYPKKLMELLAKAHAEEEEARRAKNKEVNERRDQQRQLLHQQQQVRIQMEKMCGSYNNKNGDETALVEVKSSWQDDENPADCLRQLDEFYERMREGNMSTPESASN